MKARRSKRFPNLRKSLLHWLNTIRVVHLLQRRQASDNDLFIRRPEDDLHMRLTCDELRAARHEPQDDERDLGQDSEIAGEGDLQIITGYHYANTFVQG